ncbi:MAG: Cof-type HAD-IIB family hydrolase [Desulfobacula sp.]|nr:Cof-type HAD-IIB family hydrolase [Desulfobacula sp.]
MKKEVSQFCWKPNAFFNGRMILNQGDYIINTARLDTVNFKKRIVMNPKIVITDFDGTLLNNKKRISNEDFHTLEKLRQKKIGVAIATGRSLESFRKALSDIGYGDLHSSFPVDYVMFSTGAGILDFYSQKIIFKRSIPKKGVVRISRYFDKQKIDYMVHKAIPETSHLLYKSHGQTNKDFHMRLDLYNAHAMPLENNANQFESATQVLAIIPDRPGKKIIVKIQQALSCFSVIPATSPLDHRSLWIEVFHDDVSKSKAADWLCRKLKIEKADVVAVGNDYNDHDLLAWAGRGFVVGNAPDLLKSRFSIVETNNNSGFSRAVNAVGFN